MGWSFTSGASRSDVIADLTKGWDGGDYTVRCVRKALRGNTLYAVMENTPKEPVLGPPTRWLGVSLLARHGSYGWGSKDMSESMGPCEVSCPLAFLDQELQLGLGRALGMLSALGKRHVAQEDVLGVKANFDRLGELDLLFGGQQRSLGDALQI